MPPSTEQQAYKVLVNVGLIWPNNLPPSAVMNIVVIDNDDVSDTADGTIKVQESKREGTNSAPETHKPDTSETETDRISASLDGGSFFQ